MTFKRNLKREDGQESSTMNGEHTRIYEKIQDLEKLMVGVKKDIGFINKNFNIHLKNFSETAKETNSRLNLLEAWRFKMIGAACLVSFIGAGGVIIILKTIGW